MARRSGRWTAGPFRGPWLRTRSRARVCGWRSPPRPSLSGCQRIVSCRLDGWRQGFLSNALEYCFPNGCRSKVRDAIRLIGLGPTRLTVLDDGASLLRRLRLGRGRSLGLLIEWQQAERIGAERSVGLDRGIISCLELPPGSWSWCGRTQWAAAQVPIRRPSLAEGLGAPGAFGAAGSGRKAPALRTCASRWCREGRPRAGEGCRSQPP